jgi:hypothetical protein
MVFSRVPSSTLSTLMLEQLAQSGKRCCIKAQVTLPTTEKWIPGAVRSADPVLNVICSSGAKISGAGWLNHYISFFSPPLFIVFYCYIAVYAATCGAVKCIIGST